MEKAKIVAACANHVLKRVVMVSASFHAPL